MERKGGGEGRWARLRFCVNSIFLFWVFARTFLCWGLRRRRVGFLRRRTKSKNVNAGDTPRSRVHTHVLITTSTVFLAELFDAINGKFIQNGKDTYGLRGVFGGISHDRLFQVSRINPSQRRKTERTRTSKPKVRQE